MPAVPIRSLSLASAWHRARGRVLMAAGRGLTRRPPAHGYGDKRNIQGRCDGARVATARTSGNGESRLLIMLPAHFVSLRVNHPPFQCRFGF